MSQSRRLSAVEAAANVTAGWLVALAIQVLVFPVIGLQVMFWQNVVISAVFTTVSFLRSYLLRRLFEECAGPPGGGSKSGGTEVETARSAFFTRGHDSDRGSVVAKED